MSALRRRASKLTPAQSKADAAFRAEIDEIRAKHHEAHLNRPAGDGLQNEIDERSGKPTGRRVPPPARGSLTGGRSDRG